MRRVSNSSLNTTSRLIPESRICLPNKLTKSSPLMVTMPPETSSTTLPLANLPPGVSRFKLCLPRMLRTTSGTFSISPRSGPTRTIPWSTSERWSSTETPKTISLMLSNPLSLPLIWSPVLSLPKTRCSKEDSSLTPIPTDTDLVATTTKSPSTAHTDPRSPTDKEMASWSSMETKVATPTTNPTPSTVPSKTPARPSHNSKSKVTSSDSLPSTPTATSSNQEISSERS
mmetsp:Transcript_35989/g.32372  ORF Transcript_35989/g.32372 Transcript_35989/m.32372 type:complete len:229 (+) Transcript_35989:113-799(+)